MTAAAVTQGFAIEVPQKAQEGEYFVFYAADNITGEVKSNNPLWRFGGLLRPKMKSLTHLNGFIRKCEITQLRPAMIAEAIHNIQPNERKHLIPNYILREGTETRVIGKLADGRHDGLLRTQWHPSAEVDVFTSKVDGLIKMPIATAAEAIQAQYFLFPDWDQIVAGSAVLSRRISDLLIHFQQRLKEAENDFQLKVAQAAIRSCEDYQTWGRRVTADANTMYERMKTKGEAWPIGADASGAFDQLGLQRQDNLVQEQGNQLATLTNVMSRLADLEIKRQEGDAPAAPVDPDYAEFLAWKQAQKPVEVAELEAFAEEPAGATKEAPVALYPAGALVQVDGRAATVVDEHVSVYGKPGARVKFMDDETVKMTLFKNISVIEEEK